MKQVLAILALLLSLPFVTAAQAIDEPELDERVRVLSQQLRCLVCQNETLADSQAMLATDLKRQIREQMKAGKLTGYTVFGDRQRYLDRDELARLREPRPVRKVKRRRA